MVSALSLNAVNNFVHITALIELCLMPPSSKND